MTVPEVRGGERGRSLTLRVARMIGTRRDLPPVVAIAGGPGQSAVDVLPLTASGWLAGTGRTVMAVEQRGSGGTHALKCAMPDPAADPQYFLRDIFHDADGLARCRDSLSRRADLRYYTSEDAAHDLDEVLASLGITQVDLVAGSYGTRAALVFMRRYPSRVRSAVLNGLAPFAARNPLHHARGAQAAFDRMAADCAGNPACASAYPDLPGLLNRVLDRAIRDPLSAEVELPGGTRRTVRVDREAVAEGIRAHLYWMPGARDIPKLLALADRGDVTQLAQAILFGNIGLRATLPLGMNLSVTCGEDVPRIDDAAVMTGTRGTFLGSTRVDNQRRVCAAWPRRAMPPDFAAPIPARVPVLLLSGSHDPATGPDWGEATLALLPDAVHVVVPGAHNIGGPCVDRIRQAFLATPDPRQVDTACVADMSLPPFSPGPA